MIVHFKPSFTKKKKFEIKLYDHPFFICDPIIQTKRLNLKLHENPSSPHENSCIPNYEKSHHIQSNSY